MSKTNKDRILDYLWSISPDWAPNNQIREATGIGSHQRVYLLTQELMHSRLIRGEQRGREWIFRADESLAIQLASPGRASYSAPTTFLVFGNDRQVPVLWLQRYGNLASGVAFYFLTDDGVPEQLNSPDRLEPPAPR